MELKRVDSSYEWKTRLLLNETVSRCQLKLIDFPPPILILLFFNFSMLASELARLWSVTSWRHPSCWSISQSEYGNVQQVVFGLGWRGRKIFDNIKNPFESKKDALELLMDSRNELGSFGGDGYGGRRVISRCIRLCICFRNDVIMTASENRATDYPRA